MRKFPRHESGFRSPPTLDRQSGEPISAEYGIASRGRWTWDAGRGAGIPRLVLATAALLLHFAIASSVRAAPPDPTRTFVEASRAYDENRLPDAIAGWESLRQQGQVLPEVLFNLGNAYYRYGDLGQAIRAYRHAQLLAPRDPDIRANLGFAAQTAGISLPVRQSLPDRLLLASRQEWLWIAGMTYGLLSLALAAWILSPRHRFLARPAALFAAALLTLASAGLWAHRDLLLYPECVVRSGGHKVMSGPLETATPLLAIPEGAIVRQLHQRGGWIEIQSDASRGWLPAAALAPVR